MLLLNKIHHIAIIVSDYKKSKWFYTHVLGLKIIKETYRAERKSYKLDLRLGNQYVIELFSFPSSPKRLTRPEAIGLRHLAFEVDDIVQQCESLQKMKIDSEPIRQDEITGKRFTFFFDPDDLPIELCEK